MARPYREREEPNPAGIQQRWGPHALGTDPADLPAPEIHQYPADPGDADAPVTVIEYPQSIEIGTEYGVSAPIGKTGDTRRIEDILVNLTDHPPEQVVDDVAAWKREKYQRRFEPLLNGHTTLPESYAAGLEEVVDRHLRRVGKTRD
ncbi:MAG: hypothetical protein SVU88_01395 [Candidatus Nanohaloarchaea archaeon]|nr:hypothetical protein [Candidatus Nanohaloarchaea archaeon]